MTVDLDDAVVLALTGARRIALVGASPDPWRDSHDVMGWLLRAGYDVVPVNPHVDEVLGRTAYPDLTSVPGRIDLVNVFRAPQHLVGVAREAVARPDVGVVWNQLGLRSQEARQVVRGAGRAYVEDRCSKVEAVMRRCGPPAGPRIEHPYVLLDFDDTIVDHDACERSATAATLARAGLPDGDDAVDTYVAINDGLWDRYRAGEIDAVELRVERWRRTLAVLDPTAGEEQARSIAEVYLHRFRAAAVLLPRAAEAIWWLRRRSRVAVASNGLAGVQASRLEAARLGGLVDVVVSSEEVGAVKPDPTILRTALTRMGAGAELDADGLVDAERVVMVGDGLGVDVAAGEALGATTVWIAPVDAEVTVEGPVPDHRVAHLADLA